MRTGALFFIAGLVLVSGGVQAAAIPQGSRFDSRMQQVAYHPRNTTLVYAAEGYVSTLVFSEEEEVISTQTGFTKGWNVTKEGNRVYIRVAPVKQPIRTIKSGEDGDEEVESERVFEPQDKDWRTNLFVTTTKHVYSLELRLIDKGQPLSQLAYVIDYRYPQEEHAQTRKTQQARQREWEKAQMKQSIAQAFDAAQAPRNWDYYMRVAKDSRDIAPDFAYDDGRFTYLGFSPIKTFPAAFVAYGEKEHIVNASVQQKGNYKVLVIHQINPRFVLRAGHKVVGIENHGVGKVTVPDGNTISPHVQRVETEQ